MPSHAQLGFVALGLWWDCISRHKHMAEWVDLSLDELGSDEREESDQGSPTPPKGITPLSSSSHRLHLLSISHLSFLPPWGIGLSCTELGGNLTKPCYLILDLLSYCVGLSSLASTGAPSQHQGSLCKGFALKALHMVEPVTSLCCLYRTVVLNLWVASPLGVSNDPFTGVA